MYSKVKRSLSEHFSVCYYLLFSTDFLFFDYERKIWVWEERDMEYRTEVPGK